MHQKLMGSILGKDPSSTQVQKQNLLGGAYRNVCISIYCIVSLHTLPDSPPEFSKAALRITCLYAFLPRVI